MTFKKVLNRMWKGWKRVGQLIGDLIARLVLTIFYFTIFAPFGLAVRLLGIGNPIVQPDSNLWVSRDPVVEDLKRARRLG